MKKLQSKSFRPNIETLETRLCLSVTYDGLGTLTIVGDDGANRVKITDMPGGRGDAFLVEGASNMPWIGNTSLVKKVIVNLKGGDDFFELTSEADIRFAKDFAIKLGDGHNVASVHLGKILMGGTRPDSGNYVIDLHGGQQQDDVTADFGWMSRGTHKFTAHLGGGDDVFVASVFGNIDTGRMKIKAFGEVGNDTLTGSVGADYLDGGAGNDTIHAGSGDDTILGSSGIDYLYGEGGKDNLNGGKDGVTDFLFGGGDIDTFIQQRQLDWLGRWDQERIMDLEPGDIVFSGLPRSPR